MLQFYSELFSKYFSKHFILMDEWFRFILGPAYPAVFLSLKTSFVPCNYNKNDCFYFVDMPLLT